MLLTRRTVGRVLVLAAVAPFLAFAVPQAVGASHSYVVLSSSMSPAIEAGDVVFVSDVRAEAIADGDVVTYTPVGEPLSTQGERITHRVVDVVDRNDGLYFETKGDANDAPDEQLVPADRVVGRVTLHLPALGYVISAAGTRLGMLALVVAPATALVGVELRDLWRAFDEHSDTADDQPADRARGEER